MTSTGRGARSQDPQDVAARQRLAEWAKRYSDAVVDGVLFYRDKRDLKNADLIDRLGKLGWDVTPNTLAGILGKKRSSMPVTDVMLFAAALNVPPAALLFATHTNAEQRLAPQADRMWKPYEAAKWFAGSLALPIVEFDDGRSDVGDDYYEVGDIVSRAEEVEQSMWRFTMANARLIQAQREGNGVELWSQRASEALEDLAEQRRYLRVFHPDASLPEVRQALGFVDEPKRKWPALPLQNFNTERELDLSGSGPTVPDDIPEDVRNELAARRQELLDQGINGGTA